LQQTFIQRFAKLSKQEDAWILQVEQVAFDMLLQKLPWGYGMIKLPWMQYILRTEWA
jgi:hypothetical protein